MMPELEDQVFSNMSYERWIKRYHDEDDHEARDYCIFEVASDVVWAMEQKKLDINQRLAEKAIFDLSAWAEKFNQIV